MKYLIILVIFCTVFSSAIIAYTTKDETRICVTEKERVVTQDSSKYLIFTQDEVFENTDSIWYLKFGSSDIFGKMATSECYDVSVYGFRVPFLSWYRNIIEIK